MIILLFKSKIKYLFHNPFKFIAYLFFLSFIILNIYLIKLLINESYFNFSNPQIYLNILPFIIVLFSGLLPQFRLNVVLFSPLFPISNAKNALLSLLNELFGFGYIMSYFILIEFLILFDYNDTMILKILLIIFNIAIFKFFTYYFIWKINFKSLLNYISSALFILLSVYLYVKYLNIFLLLLISILHFIFYLLRFSCFRIDYFSLNKKKRNIFPQIISVFFNIFYEYKSLWFLYFIVKIGFILFISIYYFINNSIFLNDLELMIVLSPLFLYSYFFNNYFVLNYRINKILYLVFEPKVLILIIFLLIFSISCIDFILTIPVFIVIKLKYINEYLFLFFSFMFSSFFISLFFPKEKIHSNYWIKGTTSAIGIFVFLIFISFEANKSFNIYIKTLPLILSFVLFFISINNFTKKLIKIFEQFN